MAPGIVKPIVSFSANVKPDDLPELVELGVDGFAVVPIVRQGTRVGGTR